MNLEILILCDSIQLKMAKLDNLYVLNCILLAICEVFNLC